MAFEIVENLCYHAKQFRAVSCESHDECQQHLSTKILDKEISLEINDPKKVFIVDKESLLQRSVMIQNRKWDPKMAGVY